MVKLFNTAITCGTVLRTKRTDNLVRKTYQLFVIPHHINQSSKKERRLFFDTVIEQEEENTLQVGQSKDQLPASKAGWPISIFIRGS